VVGLLEELRQGALEALEHEMKVDDLVDADRLASLHRLRRAVRLDAVDIDCAACYREHHDEGHLALCACDLKVEPLLLVAEDLDTATLEAAPAHRAVVEPRTVADELDDAHRKPILRRLRMQPGHQVLGGSHGHDSKMAVMKPRFLADCNVGRLARWLRALGYDASYHTRIGDAELVREAAAESRVVLTRDRDLTKRRVIQSGVVRAILIRDDDVTKQLRQVFAELGLELKEALTRCIECNSELQPRVPSTVAERVPPYVRMTQSRYSECPDCGRIYWAGTHWQRMREVLAGL
jgi:uncharacterized protein